MQFGNLLFNYEIFWVHYYWKGYQIFTASINKKVESSLFLTGNEQNHWTNKKKLENSNVDIRLHVMITEYLLEIKKSY